ncbi:GNAT family N-acetyltransferase [Kutzneria sp. NPDC052558]|uniref:GNAT family N-acetyltransferase n=1 Tax=Kutzneria sp. NPDC052558 TaxID=3364121 RepID=UPI0037C99A58
MIRRVRESDVDAVVQLVHDLAEYERALQECHLTAEQLRTALFGPSPALFGHVAEAADGEIVGMSLWFLSFSTWTGTHGLYLEDLFVKPEHRGGGHGRELFLALAKESADRGLGRFEWSVLDWNQPAIDFYEAMGATQVKDWHRYRLADEALAKAAARA